MRARHLLVLLGFVVAAAVGRLAASTRDVASAQLSPSRDPLPEAPVLQSPIGAQPELRPVVHTERGELEEHPDPSADLVAKRSSDARARVQLVVDRVLTSRVLDEQASVEIRSGIVDMTDDDRRVVLAALIPAINRQEVRIAVEGPLF